MSKEKQVRFLKLYAVLTALLLGVLVLTAFKQANPKTRFTEIDVEHINIIEKDAAPGVQDTKVTPLVTKDLAGLTGKEAVMLTVEYAPGATSSKHRHNANTFVYVLEGSIVMQVDGGKAVTLGPGQTFYESPDDVHVVSKNASDSQPAKFLVFFVKDKGAASLVPVK